MRASFQAVVGRIVSLLLLLAAWTAHAENQPERSRFGSEEIWIVDDTARGIAEMLAFARNPGANFDWGTPRTEDQPQRYEFLFSITGGGLRQKFQITDYAWSPDAYEVWAAQILKKWSLTAASTSQPSEGFLLNLANATSADLQAEGKRLSTALTRAPLDASLHEQAALVIAAFAMREAAGPFTDIRRELSRMAAHLAIARALQPASGSEWRLLGECALQTLAGREAPALEQIQKLPEQTPGNLSWKRALRLRNTQDWRENTNRSVAIETIEAFRARTSSVDERFALRWLTAQDLKTTDDCRHIVLHHDFSVASGHQFVLNSIGEEIRSLQADWKTYHGSTLDPADAIKALNEPAARAVVRDPGAAPGIRVLGWDFWSAQHQRHLCQSICATQSFLRDKLGVPQYRELHSFVKLNFPDLTLFPLLERSMSEGSAQDEGAAQRIRTLMTTHPELINPALWTEARRGDAKLAVPNNWFNPILPFGTTYDYQRRSGALYLPAGTAPWWKEVTSLAPSNLELISRHMVITGQINPSPEFVESQLAAFLPYDLRALSMLARSQEGNPGQFAATMEKICALDSTQYFALGDSYVVRHETEKAAAAFQKGVDLSDDRIGAANGCGWLIDYLEDTGKPDRATAIAKMAADVYSFRGLENQARLYERRGQLKEAEEYFEKIEERYQISTRLIGFFTRHRKENSAYEQRASKAEKGAFPNGLKPTTVASFPAAPAAGVRLAGSNKLTAAAGLRANDVIVALDGYAVESPAQYEYLTGLRLSRDLNLIVWDGTSYREVIAYVPRHQLDVSVVPFK